MALFKGKKTQKVHLGVVLGQDFGAVVALDKPMSEKPRVLLAESFVSDGDVPSELRSRVQKGVLKDAPAIAVGAPGQYTLMQVEPPDVPPDELTDAVRWQVRDLVDFPVETALLDLFHVPEIPQQRKLAYAAVAPPSAFHSLIELTEDLQLACETIDITELALTHLLTRHPDQDVGVGGLFLTRHGGVLVVVRQGALYFSRGLSIGTDRLQMDAQTGDALSLLVLELQRSLDYFEGSVLRSQIASLQIFPTEVELPGFPEQLGSQMTTRVAGLNVYDLFEMEQPLEPADLYRCLIPLGGALREVER